MSAQSYSTPIGQGPLTRMPDVHFDQKVNTQIPLDLNFQDEAGRNVFLKQYFDGKHPVILVMPFYKCMSGCTLELQGMARCFNQMKYKIGDEFRVVTVSINPKETAVLAAAHKATYTGLLKVPFKADGWSFLTGTQANIQELTKTVGFHYVYNLETEQFLHPNGIIVLTPTGKTYRYFLSTEFDARDVGIALTKASQNQIGTVIDQLVSLCCAYDPTTGHYGVLIHRVIEIAGCGTVLILGISIFLMLRWEKKHWNKPPAAPTTATGPGAV